MLKDGYKLIILKMTVLLCYSEVIPLLFRVIHLGVIKSF